MSKEGTDCLTEGAAIRCTEGLQSNLIRELTAEFLSLCTLWDIQKKRVHK